MCVTFADIDFIKSQTWIAIDQPFTQTPRRFDVTNVVPILHVAIYSRLTFKACTNVRDAIDVLYVKSSLIRLHNFPNICNLNIHLQSLNNLDLFLDLFMKIMQCNLAISLHSPVFSSSSFSCFHFFFFLFFSSSLSFLHLFFFCTHFGLFFHFMLVLCSRLLLFWHLTINQLLNSLY